jgi:hypothetical protein
MDEVIAKNAFPVYDEAVAPARGESARYPIALGEPTKRITHESQADGPDLSLPWACEKGAFGHYREKDSLQLFKARGLVPKDRALEETKRGQETQGHVTAPQAC